MLDPKLFRTELDAILQLLARRGFTLDAQRLTALESERKEIQVQTQDLQNERNKRSKEIGMVKAKGGDIQPLLTAVTDLGDKLKAAEERLNVIQSDSP